MSASYDAGKGRLTIPRTGYEFPGRCLGCGADTRRLLSITGTPKTTWTLTIMLLFRVASQIRIDVPFCIDCSRFDLKRQVIGWTLGAAVLLGGAPLLPMGRVGPLIGVSMMLLGPIAVAAWTISRARSPVLWHFDDSTIEIKLRGPAAREPRAPSSGNGGA